MNLDVFALYPINSQSSRILSQSNVSIDPEKLTIHDLNNIRISLEKKRDHAAEKLGAHSRRQRKNLMARLNRRFKTNKTTHYEERESLYLLKMEFYRTGKQISDVMDQIIVLKN